VNDYKHRVGLATIKEATAPDTPGRQRRPPKPLSIVGAVLDWKPGCTKKDIVYVIRLMDNSLSEVESSIVTKSHPEKLIDFYEKLVGVRQLPPPRR
jgi:hypothetical protein